MSGIYASPLPEYRSPSQSAAVTVNQAASTVSHVTNVGEPSIAIAADGSIHIASRTVMSLLDVALRSIKEDLHQQRTTFWTTAVDRQIEESQMVLQQSASQNRSTMSSDNGLVMEWDSNDVRMGFSAMAQVQRYRQVLEEFRSEFHASLTSCFYELLEEEAAFFETLLPADLEDSILKRSGKDMFQQGKKKAVQYMVALKQSVAGKLREMTEMKKTNERLEKRIKRSTGLIDKLRSTLVKEIVALKSELLRKQKEGENFELEILSLFDMLALLEQGHAEEEDETTTNSRRIEIFKKMREDQERMRALFEGQYRREIERRDKQITKMTKDAEIRAGEIQRLNDALSKLSADMHSSPPPSGRASPDAEKMKSSSSFSNGVDTDQQTVQSLVSTVDAETLAVGSPSSSMTDMIITRSLEAKLRVQTAQLREYDARVQQLQQSSLQRDITIQTLQRELEQEREGKKRELDELRLANTRDLAKLKRELEKKESEMALRKIEWAKDSRQRMSARDLQVGKEKEDLLKQVAALTAEITNLRTRLIDQKRQSRDGRSSTPGDEADFLNASSGTDSDRARSPSPVSLVKTSSSMSMQRTASSLTATADKDKDPIDKDGANRKDKRRGSDVTKERKGSLPKGFVRSNSSLRRVGSSSKMSMPRAPSPTVTRPQDSEGLEFLQLEIANLSDQLRLSQAIEANLTATVDELREKLLDKDKELEQLSKMGALAFMVQKERKNSEASFANVETSKPSIAPPVPIGLRDSSDSLSSLASTPMNVPVATQGTTGSGRLTAISPSASSPLAPLGMNAWVPQTSRGVQTDVGVDPSMMNEASLQRHEFRKPRMSEAKSQTDLLAADTSSISGTVSGPPSASSLSMPLHVMSTSPVVTMSDVGSQSSFRENDKSLIFATEAKAAASQLRVVSHNVDHAELCPSCAARATTAVIRLHTSAQTDPIPQRFSNSSSLRRPDFDGQQHPLRPNSTKNPAPVETVANANSTLGHFLSRPDFPVRLPMDDSNRKHSFSQDGLSSEKRLSSGSLLMNHNAAILDGESLTSLIDDIDEDADPEDGILLADGDDFVEQLDMVEQDYRRQQQMLLQQSQRDIRHSQQPSKAGTTAIADRVSSAGSATGSRAGSATRLSNPLSPSVRPPSSDLYGYRLTGAQVSLDSQQISMAANNDSTVGASQSAASHHGNTVAVGIAAPPGRPAGKQLEIEGSPALAGSPHYSASRDVAAAGQLTSTKTDNVDRFSQSSNHAAYSSLQSQMILSSATLKKADIIFDGPSVSEQSRINLASNDARSVISHTSDAQHFVTGYSADPGFRVRAIASGSPSTAAPVLPSGSVLQAGQSSTSTAGMATTTSKIMTSFVTPLSHSGSSTPSRPGSAYPRTGSPPSSRRPASASLTAALQQTHQQLLEADPASSISLEIDARRGSSVSSSPNPRLSNPTKVGGGGQIASSGVTSASSPSLAMLPSMHSRPLLSRNSVRPKSRIPDDPRALILLPEPEHSSVDLKHVRAPSSVNSRLFTALEHAQANEKRPGSSLSKERDKEREREKVYDGIHGPLRPTTADAGIVVAGRRSPSPTRDSKTSTTSSGPEPHQSNSAAMNGKISVRMRFGRDGTTAEDVTSGHGVSMW